MKKLAVMAVFAAGLCAAEPVYFSGHGKTFHSKRECGILRRSKAVYTADRKAAEAHGLTEHKCSMGKAAGAAIRGDWAKVVESLDKKGATK